MCALSVLGLERQVARVKRQRVAHHLITWKACQRAETELASYKHMKARLEYLTSSPLADWALPQSPYCMTSQKCAFIVR